jgi:hypothetical protein
MKKIVLAVVLLLLVVGTAYIKSTRGTARQREAFEAGRSEASQGLAALQRDVDSLKRLLEIQREEYADSLVVRDNVLRREISVLVGFLDSAIGLPERISDSSRATSAVDNSSSKLQAKEHKADTPPTAEEEGGPKQLTESAKAEPTPDKSVQKEAEYNQLKEKVLTHYGKLYESLPNDLTADERKVALYEISLKTAAEFSITMPQLKEFCEDYYVSY